MAKPEWGQKRTCSSCGCRFYDLARTPIVCPKCSAAVDVEPVFKVRRGASAPAPEPKVVVPVIVADEEGDVDPDDLAVIEDEEEAAEGAQEGSEDDESGLIEDASDLGEDDDDMAEVMEHMDEEIEDEV